MPYSTFSMIVLGYLHMVKEAKELEENEKEGEKRG